MAFIIRSPGFSSVSRCRCETPTKSVEKNISRIRVYSRVKDPTSTSLSSAKLGHSNNVRLYGQFSTPVKIDTASSKQLEEEKDKQNYYVNMGDAIRTLREDFPELFFREPSFDIYRDDIVFKDPLNTFVGIEKYKAIFGRLRFHGKIFFKALWIDIVSVWQPVENRIMIRWTVHGIPRVPWESRGRFDGTSEYKFDREGKIFEHQVHNVVLNAPPRFQVLGVDQLIQSLGCPSTPKPTYFEISSASIKNMMPQATHYLASFLNIARNTEPESSQRM